MVWRLTPCSETERRGTARDRVFWAAARRPAPPLRSCRVSGRSHPLSCCCRVSPACAPAGWSETSLKRERLPHTVLNQTQEDPEMHTLHTAVYAVVRSGHLLHLSLRPHGMPVSIFFELDFIAVRTAIQDFHEQPDKNSRTVQTVWHRCNQYTISFSRSSSFNTDHLEIQYCWKLKLQIISGFLGSYIYIKTKYRRLLWCRLQVQMR